MYSFIPNNPSSDDPDNGSDEPKSKRIRVSIKLDGGLPTVNGCDHDITLQQRCILCGQLIGNPLHGTSFSYLTKGLRFTQNAINSFKTRRSEKIFRRQKLHLVLDLDNTLLHSRQIQDLNPQEQYLLDPSFSDDSNLFNRYGDYLIKFRPFVREFLEEASKIFEMYIYTKGSEDYAALVAKSLDPDKKYFRDRLISRTDSPNSKTLDLVLGEERGIIVLDDNKQVWRSKHQKNLILMKKYEFYAPMKPTFEEDEEQKVKPFSYSEKRNDESFTNGALANILTLLKRIHSRLFTVHEKLEVRDVRLMLREFRREVLESCTVYFNEDDNKVRDGDYVGKVSELGGLWTYYKSNVTITHVVLTSEIGMEEDMQWAVEHEKHLVNIEWIESAYYYWKKPDEKDYLIEFNLGNTVTM